MRHLRGLWRVVGVSIRKFILTFRTWSVAEEVVDDMR
jgi:hypothetical protein